MEAIDHIWPFPIPVLPSILSLTGELAQAVNSILEKCYWRGVTDGALITAILLLILFLVCQFLQGVSGKRLFAALGILSVLIGALLVFCQIRASQRPLIDLPNPLKPAPRKPWSPFRSDEDKETAKQPMPKVCSCCDACRCGDNCTCTPECRCLDHCHCGEVAVADRSHGSYESYAPSAGAITIGGPIGPDGQTEVTCDLPVDQRTKNVGGRDGAGLCVFSSIGQAARWQHETRLEDLQQKMRSEPGGGYPDKVDAMIKKYGPGTQYLQFEGGDPKILLEALKGGRMPSITYCGMDPHYGAGKSVAHMCNLVLYDPAANLACVLDNNFIGANDLVWMTIPEFQERWKGNGGGWAVILLSPAPPPVPHN